MKKQSKVWFSSLGLLVSMQPGAVAASYQLSPTCKLRVYENKAWKNANASQFSGKTLEVDPNPNSPKFYIFKENGKTYTAPQSCFTEEMPPVSEETNTEDAGRISKGTRNGNEAFAHQWSVLIGLGMTLSPKTSHSITLSTLSNQTLTSESSDSKAAVFSLEGIYHFSKYFGLSAILESNKYNYANDTSGNGDSHVGILLMPRASLPLGEHFSLWVGAGLGVMVSSILASSDTGSGLTLSNNAQTTLGFDLSPRLGMSIYFNENNYLDVSGAYTTFGGKVTGTYTGSANGTISDSFTRNWTSVLVRYGYEW